MPGLNRIMIIGHDEERRDGLSAQLAARASLEMVGEARTAEEAVRLCRIGSPQIVVLVLDVPDRAPLDLLADLLAIEPGARVVLIADDDQRELAAPLVEAGALGVVFIREIRATLLSAVKVVAQNEVWFNALLEPRADMDDLAPRRRRGRSWFSDLERDDDRVLDEVDGKLPRQRRQRAAPIPPFPRPKKYNPNAKYSQYARMKDTPQDDSRFRKWLWGGNEPTRSRLEPSVESNEAVEPPIEERADDS